MDREVLDTRSFVTWVHCHTCHEEWLAPDQEPTCTCTTSRDERWARGRSHRQVFYSRPLAIPCTGQCRQQRRCPNCASFGADLTCTMCGGRGWLAPTPEAEK